MVFRSTLRALAMLTLLLLATFPSSAAAEAPPARYSLRLLPELTLPLLESVPLAVLEPTAPLVREVPPEVDTFTAKARTRWMAGSAMLAVSSVSLIGWAAFVGPSSEYVLDEDYVCQSGSWIPLSGIGVAALIGIPLVIAGAMKEKRGREQGGSPTVVGRRRRVRRVVGAVLGSMFLNIAGYAAAVPDFMCNT